MIVALASMPGWCAAQSITTDFDKKVIKTDSLNMPENTSMNTLLKVLPELLQRPSCIVFNFFNFFNFLNFFNFQYKYSSLKTKYHHEESIIFVSNVSGNVLLMR